MVKANDVSSCGNAIAEYRDNIVIIEHGANFRNSKIEGRTMWWNEYLSEHTSQHALNIWLLNNHCCLMVGSVNLGLIMICSTTWICKLQLSSFYGTIEAIHSTEIKSILSLLSLLYILVITVAIFIGCFSTITFSEAKPETTITTSQSPQYFLTIVLGCRD